MKGREPIDISGKRFGLLVVGKMVKRISGDTVWQCVCDCGNNCFAHGSVLRSGRKISCGCERKKRAAKANTKHGMAGTKLYHVWNKMKQRCNNKNNKEYANYGGRGIKYAKEWERFECFYEWAKDKYKNGLSIDRINNDLGYFPENCRFTNNYVQQNNKRNNHRITYKGVTKTITEWSLVVGIKKETIITRIDTLGWDPVKAITHPVNKACHPW